jgi:hypothetical protein
MVIVGTVVGLAIIAIGALVSWRVFAAGRKAQARWTISAVSLMAAALFALAIILPLIAALVIPQCWG